MKEIKLEVTQKISQNENQKLGSLQNSTTPTLLDSIYQKVLDRVEQVLHFFIPNPGKPVETRSRTYYLATQNTGFVAMGESRYAISDLKQVGEPDDWGHLEMLLHWGNHYFLFRSWGAIEIISIEDQNTLKRSKISFIGERTWSVQTTSKYIYVLSDTYEIGRIDRNLNEEILSHYGEVTDFDVDPDLGRMVALKMNGELRTQDKSQARVMVSSLQDRGHFYPIKRLYSKFFLVGETKTPNKVSRLHLVAHNSLETVQSLELGITSENIQHIRQTAPRRRGQFALLTLDNTIALVNILASQLRLVSILQGDTFGLITSLAYFPDNREWMLCADNGEVATIGLTRGKNHRPILL